MGKNDGFGWNNKPETPRTDVPYDIEVEQAFLGSMFADNELLDVAEGYTTPEDFYDPFHARIFEMMLVLRTEGDVTPLILGSVMKTDPGMIETGGANYCRALRDAAPALPNVRDLGNMLRDLAQRRRLIEAGEALIAQARETKQFSTTATKMAEEMTDEIAGITVGGKSGKHRRGIEVGDALDTLIRDISEQASSDTPISIPTGLPRLDGILGGFLPGKLYIAGGRPGMGKTILATTFAKAAAQAGFTADYYSGEMDEAEIAARMGCDIDFDRCFDQRLKPLAYQDFVNMRVSGEHLVRMMEASDKLKALPVKFFDAGRLTIEYIVSNARRRHRLNPGRHLIIVDHLQKVHWDGKPRDASRVQEISEVTGQLKTLAKDLGASVFALSQLSRDIETREDKHPRQPDFRDGGSVEENADVLIGIMRPLRYAAEAIRAAKTEEAKLTAIGKADEAKGKLEIAVLKQRAGPEVDYFDIFIDERASAIRDESPGSMPTQDLFF